MGVSEGSVLASGGGSTISGRAYLDAAVSERATHASAEAVRVTCSFARAERLLGREYHGRFLIELLQNAADAWRNDPRRRGDGDRCRVAIVLTEGPALLVANQGAPMTAQVVTDSLGHIGASTKPEGEAIGHKGIGFKSVLELTLTPEIYSGLAGGDDDPGLAVAFDPEVALERIRSATRGPEGETWDDLITTVDGIDHGDELAGVPVLRFPRWLDHPPSEVLELAAAGFDTVVRLPFGATQEARLGLDRNGWLSTVRQALEDITDEILVLLGCFAEVTIEDLPLGDLTTIVPEWLDDLAELAGGGTREQVVVRRNQEVTSRWQLYRRTLPTHDELAGEIAVGLRVGEPADGAQPAPLLPALDDAASAPFHLFFPTRIPSGLPFLLHGYFEVDAARTGFYQGSAGRNAGILEALAGLTAAAVGDAAATSAVDLVTLVDLVAAAPEPTDGPALTFHADVLRRLDEVAWIPLSPAPGAPDRLRPDEVLAAGPELNRRIGTVFSPAYTYRTLALGVPDPRMSNASMALIAWRWSEDSPFDVFDALARLCRPGAEDLWSSDVADRRFLGLLDLYDVLEVEDRERAHDLLRGLRGDPDSRLLPVVSPSGRELLPIPDPSEGQAGNRSRLVMARVRAAGGGDPLVPPSVLDVAFLPDGLLASEQDIDRAKVLGVRPFTVDNVLDRLNGLRQAEFDGPALLSFLWRLLVRERLSAFGTHRGADRAATFDPSQWAWCRPGRAREDETNRLRQQRERYLADVPVPCRDGKWRPASEVAFGADWATWIEGGALGALTPAHRDRIAAYRAIEAICPGHPVLLASPDELAAALPDTSFDPASFVASDPGADLDGGPGPTGSEGAVEAETDRPTRRHAERHAFLLRLGVAEVPPVEAWETRDQAQSAFPWEGPIRTRQDERCRAEGQWAFGFEDWSGQQHHNVRLGEDFRLRWDLDEMAERDPRGLVTALRLGAPLYQSRRHAAVFCTGCSDSGSHHKAWRDSSPADGYPSWLALQLEETAWVPATVDGETEWRRVRPRDAWWHANPPTGAGLRQSPFRLLPLCGPHLGVSDELRHLAGVEALDEAGVTELGALLTDLRSRLENAELAADPATSGSARQALIGLHRIIYDRMADLSGADLEAAAAVDQVLDQVGVLCELGDRLLHLPVAEARHDDGAYASYVRRFLGLVPLAVIARERTATAKRLGIAPLEIHITRRDPDDEGRDVTAEVRAFLGDRLPELLSIVVHHSLGTQTLEVTSAQFDERTRRLRQLTVRQLDDLVITATVAGTSHVATFGDGPDQDLYLEGPTTPSPVLFHDLHGPGWEDRLRRRLAPHLAAILENPAYHHTFALFLQADSDAEREEFLLELGISADEVDSIASRIGAVTEHEQARHRSWFLALGAVRSGEPPQPSELPDLDPDRLTEWLERCGYGATTARRLVEAGGGEEVRRNAGDAPLRWLRDDDIDLAALDSALHDLGDSGLRLTVARQRFTRWIDVHGRRLAVVLERAGQAPEEAKASVTLLEPPAAQAFALDPALSALLDPVVVLLRDVGRPCDVSALADEPERELSRLAGVDDVDELDAQVAVLYDPEEQARVLRERATRWRSELRLFAVLALAGEAETRAGIRSHAEDIDRRLPAHPATPSALAGPAEELFARRPHLSALLASELTDHLGAAPPDRAALAEAAGADGLDEGRLDRIVAVLQAPARSRGRELRSRVDRLVAAAVRPARPTTLGPPPTPPAKPDSGPDSPKPVSRTKVDPSHDQRKRKLGDEGEQWALAAVLEPLLKLDLASRSAAIDELVELLGHFEGAPVDAALGYAERARAADLDQEELADELAGLLHVAQHSDAFGFDLLGWFPAGEEDGGGRPVGAVCLEVKSSSGEGFHLSSGEWTTAERFKARHQGDRYAVLVVRRAKTGGVPEAMDLLADPVQLEADEKLRLDVDGWFARYTTD